MKLSDVSKVQELRYERDKLVNGIKQVGTTDMHISVRSVSRIILEPGHHEAVSALIRLSLENQLKQLDAQLAALGVTLD